MNQVTTPMGVKAARLQAGDTTRRYHEHVAYERITTDPAVMGGLPCIRGLRFPVANRHSFLSR